MSSGHPLFDAADRGKPVEPPLPESPGGYGERNFKAPYLNDRHHSNINEYSIFEHNARFFERNLSIDATISEYYNSLTSQCAFVLRQFSGLSVDNNKWNNLRVKLSDLLTEMEAAAQEVCPENVEHIRNFSQLTPHPFSGTLSTRSDSEGSVSNDLISKGIISHNAAEVAGQVAVELRYGATGPSKQNDAGGVVLTMKRLLERASREERIQIVEEMRKGGILDAAGLKKAGRPAKPAEIEGALLKKFSKAVAGFAQALPGSEPELLSAKELSNAYEQLRRRGYPVRTLKGFDRISAARSLVRQSLKPG